MGVTAILVAGGHSARMKGTDKMTLKLDGVTVLERSLRAFALHPEVDAVVAVTRPDLIPLVERWRTRYPKITAVVAGGETRCLSVKAGIAAVPETAEFVAIHDGARPFVSAELITEVIRAAEEIGLPSASEVFADRAYEEDGSLRARSKPDAVIHDEAECAARVLRMVTEGKVTAVTGRDIDIRADSICVHGDSPEALLFVRRIRETLKNGGVEIKPF